MFEVIPLVQVRQFLHSNKSFVNLSDVSFFNRLFILMQIFLPWMCNRITIVLVNDSGFNCMATIAYII